MTYRFLLDVPGPLADQANITVTGVDGAQVVVSRASLADGFDQPHTNLTIASQNLVVIDALYDWFETVPAAMPDAKIVLTNGRGVKFGDRTRAEMISAIRRDQPWAERSMPRIGDHVEYEFVEPQAAPTNPMDDELALVGSVQFRDDHRLLIENPSSISVKVTNLRKAEDFYREFFQMDVMSRARLTKSGDLETLRPDYNWEDAVLTNTSADESILQNGNLKVLLRRIGLGTPVMHAPQDRIAIDVDVSSFDALKAWTLMRSFELLATGNRAFSFRDPFGVIWDVAAT